MSILDTHLPLCTELSSVASLVSESNQQDCAMLAIKTEHMMYLYEQSILSRESSQAYFRVATY